MTLRHQLIAGVILGAIGTVVAVVYVIYKAVADYDDDTEEIIDNTWGSAIFILPGALVVWFLFAILGSVFNWGFGFGYGWAFALLAGFPPILIGGMSLISSICICGVALTKSPEEIHRKRVEQEAHPGY